MSVYNVQILPAVFTPMYGDASINYTCIEPLYQRCIQCGYKGIFLNGTTGECMSLSMDERQKLVEGWVACRKKNNDPAFKIFVHVGSNNLYEAADMAAHAQALGADGIAMVPTFYFRPKTLEDLIGQCRFVACAAPEVPFYYYNIPALTGVNFPLISFVQVAAKQIPTFSGLKNSYHDLSDYQQCIHFAKDHFDMYWGTDELFMVVYAAGNHHYVGSTYNFMGGLYQSMLNAYHSGNFDQLAILQKEANEIFTILNHYNSLIAGKEVMRKIGIDCGPVRKPLRNLHEVERGTLFSSLQNTRFFDYTMTKNQ